MAYPPPTIDASKTDTTQEAGDHPAHHNALANAVNDIVTQVNGVGSTVSGLGSTVTTLQTDVALRTPLAVAAPTGSVATDTASIQAKVNAAAAAGGGEVQLQAGTYRVTSVSHPMASVTYATGAWTVNSGTVPTVGQYIIGPGINGRAPVVLTAGASTFTTDIPPGGTVAAAAIKSITPGVFLPDGVSIVGRGAAFGGGTPLSGGTTIYDDGTGATIFLRGGNPTVGGFYYARSKVKELSVWGSANGTSIGSTLAGVWINCNSMFLEINQVDIAGHLKYGLALDYNNNNLYCQSVSFRHCGDASDSNQGGGVIIDPFNGYVSADLAFYNCTFQGCVGFGLCGTAQDPISLYSCQWNGTVTSASYQSGTSVFVSGNTATLVNCWSESASTLDMFISYGNATIVGGNFNTSASYSILVGAAVTLALVGVEFINHSTATINYADPTSTVTWSGCVVNDSTFIAGGPTPAHAAGSGVHGNGAPVYSGSVITPTTAVTVAANAGTVAVKSSVSKFTNSSAATMTVTMATAGAVDGQQSVVRIFDFSAAAQTVTWVNTENSAVSVPATSNGSTTLPKTVMFQYNSATSKWRCIQVA